MSRFDRLEFEPPRTAGPSPAGPSPSPARAVDPDHDGHHWLKLADADRRHGLHESALRLYSRALERDRSLVAGWVGQVRMLIAMDEFPEAELWARKALELFKANPDLLAGRSQALTRMGDLKQASAVGDAAIAGAGTGSYPWVARGDLMLARREHLDDYCFDKAAAADPDWLVPLEVGDAYLFHDRPSKALRRFRAATEAAPDVAHLWFRRGTCERNLGLTGPAGHSFRQCLQLDPKHSPARDAVHALSKGTGVKSAMRRLFGWR